MNEHIEHYKRWSKTYLMWSHSNMDRIARETVAKHKKEMLEERRNNSPYMIQMRDLFKQSNLYFNKMAADLMKENILLSGTKWTNSLKVGQALRIKLP